MDIVGFLPCSSIPCIPTVTSHLLLPFTLFTSGSDNAPETDESLHLCLILNSTLKEKSMMALIKMPCDQYGILCVMQKSNSSCLVFHFIPENINIPWLGNINDLILSSKKDIPIVHDNWEAFPASYFAKKSNILPIPSISGDSIQVSYFFANYFE